MMTEVAGEVADGFICHGFTTRQYMTEVTVPALEKGRAKAGKTLEGFDISGPMFVVTGRDEADGHRAAAGVRGQIAFYGSTPAYRKVLELHGWGDLQDELNRLSKEGRWAEMGRSSTTTCSTRSRWWPPWTRWPPSWSSGGATWSPA